MEKFFLNRNKTPRIPNSLMPVIPVSWGEIVDKLTILEIKNELILDPEKKLAVQRQYHSILDHLADDPGSFVQKGIQGGGEIISHEDEDYQSFYQINRKLWDCENLIRSLTREENFGKDYVQVSQDIRTWNDERARIKKRIDQRWQSDFWDVKNHPGI